MNATEPAGNTHDDPFFARGWRVYSLGEDHFLWDAAAEYLVRLPATVVAAWARHPPPTRWLQEAVSGGN